MTDFERYLRDYQSTFYKGVNTALLPRWIGNDQVVWQRNRVVRGGKSSTRKPFVEVYKLPFGIVQGVKAFQKESGLLVFSISGKLYRGFPNGVDFIFEEIILPEDRSRDEPITYMQQTTEYLVVQDGLSKCYVYDGTSIRSTLDGEVPIGKAMAYANGRLWVSQSGGRLVAGDIVGTSDGSELNFTENTYLLGGGSFRMPSEITGMVFIPSNDSQTGYGPLLVFGKNYTVAIRADITQRELWSDTQGFQSTIFQNIGCLSHNSIVQSNLDIYWIDGSGRLRTFRQAIADYSTAGSTPVDREISRLGDFQSPDMMNYATCKYFDNRIFGTTSPFFVHKDIVAYRDMFSMDLSPISTMGQKGMPCYDGEFEGIYITHMEVLNFEGRDRLFIIGKESDGTNRLFEYDPKYNNDRYILGNTLKDNLIESTIESREFYFDNETIEKRLDRLELWISDIFGYVEIKIYARRDQETTWRYWDVVSFNYSIDSQDGIWKEIRNGYKSKLIPFTASEWDEHLTGFGFQILLKIKGNVSIDKMMLYASVLDQKIYPQDVENGTLSENIVEIVEEEYHIPFDQRTFDNYSDGTTEYSDSNGVIYNG